MVSSSPSILLKAWSSFRREVVIALTVEVLMGVTGNKVCTWLGQEMIKLMEGTRLEVERIAKLKMSLRQLATFPIPGWC